MLLNPIVLKTENWWFYHLTIQKVLYILYKVNNSGVLFQSYPSLPIWYSLFCSVVLCNTFGKVFIEDIPGQKASMDEIKKWKNSTNVMWARDNLWSQVNESKKDNNTYINRITNQVFKVNNLTTNNCLFVLAVVDIIFDVNVLSMTLTGETITNRMNKLLEEKV